MSWMKRLFGKAGPTVVKVQPANIDLEVRSGETILERALKEGLAYPHDCTVGTCGACRTKLLSGGVEAITPFGYTLSKDELEAGYILACQALPRGEVCVEVELGSGMDAEVVTTPARLLSADPLTHDILRVTWETYQPISYRAGQYVNVRWNGGAIHRSYSFATAPTPGSSQVTTFIRHVPGGAFTDLLFTGDAKSATYELGGPHGQFWLREDKGPILCIAGGSGLAPIVSLLQDAAKRRVRRDCVVLFGGRGARDLYGQDEITQIRNGWTAGFDYWPVLSETPEAGMREGFVTAHIPAALEKLGPGAQAYLCGPPAMIDAAIATLTDAGVPLDRIFYDKFTDASSGAA